MRKPKPKNTRAKAIKPVAVEARTVDAESLTSETYKALTGIFAPPTLSKVVVNEQTALGITAVLCAVNTISGDIATLPPVLYRENGTKRERATDDPRYWMLLEEPNPQQTRPVFMQTLMYHALMGNGYAEIERNNAGEPIALWPIHSGNVVVKNNGNELEYEVYTDAGNVRIPASDMIHIPGLAPSGAAGMEILATCREVLGFGIAAQKYGAAFFGNAARPSGVLSTMGTLSDTARENLRKSWAQLHTGVENVGSPAILEEGFTWIPNNLTNEQNQYTEVLKYFTYLVAQIFTCPPTKLFALESATWANINELHRFYLMTTLSIWLLKAEHEYLRKLFSRDERRTFFIEFDTSQLLKVDQLTRYETYNSALAGKQWRTVNEVRAEENFEPVDGGDSLNDAPTAAEPVVQADNTTTTDTTTTEAVDTSVPVTAAPVQDSGLNGAQVASLLAIVDKVATKQYPASAAIALIKASFPLMAPEEINAIVNSAAAFDAPAPEAPTQDPNGDTNNVAA